MITGITHLRRAGKLLRHDQGDTPLALLRGASEIWAAMFELPSWPTELRSKAIELQSSLFRYGPIRMTIEQMVAPEQMQLRYELLEFVDLAERMDGMTDGAADGNGRAATSFQSLGS